MANITDRVKAVAQALITAAGLSHAVAAADIRGQAEALHREFAEYSKVDISTKIASEIRQRHTPGISGSV
jgi:hypothetical protein